MTTLQFVSELIAQHQLCTQRTREPNLQDVRTPVGITPQLLKFLQSRPFTRGLGRVLLHIGVWEFVILVTRGTKIRFKFRSAFIERHRVPEVSDTTIGDGEWETMRDQADGIDCVPV